MRSMRLAGLMVLALAASVGLAEAQGDVEQSRPLNRTGVLEIENIAGTVTVIGWNREEVKISARLGHGTRGLDISGDRNHLTIEVDAESTRWDEERGWYDDEDDDRDRDRDRGRTIHIHDDEAVHFYVDETDLELYVPRDCRLEVETISADIKVSDHDGEQDLESVSGTIDVRGRPREAELSTVSGTIELVASGDLARGDFQTVSGEIEVDAGLSPTGRFSFETISGNITLRIPRGTSAEFDVSTFSGTIRNDFGFEPKRTSRWVPTEELRFELGGGGARVTMEALNGTIRILEK